MAVYEEKHGLIIDPNEAGPAAPLLELPIHDADGTEIYKSTTHVDVLYVPESWMGFRYWGAHTPYPDLTRELPNLMVSNNGVEWKQPPGVTNPMDTNAAALAEIGGALAWLADPDLCLINGRMNLFYCYFNSNLDWRLVRRTSVNGKTWTSPQVVLSGTTPNILSPATVWDGGNNVTLFYVKGLAAGTPTIHYRESTDEGATWGSEQNCTFPKCSDDRPDFWHMDVIKIAGVYHALVLSKTSAEPFLWYYTSVDKINWTLECHDSAVPYSGNPLFDGLGYYRSSFVGKEGGLFDVFVCGQPRGASSDDVNYWPDLAVTASAGTDFVTSTGGAHYWNNGDVARFVAGTPPGNTSLNTNYYVRDRTNTTFKLALTKGGAAIDLTSNGSGLRMSRSPWRVALYRNVTLPIRPRLVVPRTALTNVNGGGSFMIPPANCINVAIAAWPTANLGFAQRFRIETPTEFRYFRTPCGTASGNIECGVLRILGGNHTVVTPLLTSGVIACPTPSGGSIRIDLGRFVLMPGEYWLWLWCDNTTATFPAAAIGYGGTFQVAQYSVVAGGGRAMPIAGAALDTTGGRAISHAMLEGDYV